MRAKPTPHAALLQGARFALTAFMVVLFLAARPALAAADLLYGQGLLWKVERAGAPPNYLFGTIHITDGRVLDLPPQVRAAFDGARSATFEVIMDDEVRLKMARAMVLSDGRTLDTILGPDLFRETAAAGARYGFEPKLLKGFKPWALAMIFSVPQAELMRNSTGDLPLDQWLQAEAKRQGKPIYALESADEQIALFNELSEADQVAMLESAIKENPRIEQVFEEMTRRYLARDIAGIYAQLDEQSKTMNPEYVAMFLARFNEARNITMAERMADRLRQGGAFVAVGALHLPGERGLVRILEKQGYSVERVY